MPPPPQIKLFSWSVVGVGTTLSFLECSWSAREVGVDTAHFSRACVLAKNREREEEVFVEGVASELSPEGRIRV